MAMPVGELEAPNFDEAEQVGISFTNNYYRILCSDQPGDIVQEHYAEHSTVLQVDGDVRTRGHGSQQIHEIIMSLNFRKVEIISINSLMSNWCGGFIVTVIGFGEIKKDSRWRKFVQSFFLVPQTKGPFVQNHILSFITNDVEPPFTASSSTHEVSDSGPPPINVNPPFGASSSNTTNSSEDPPGPLVEEFVPPEQLYQDIGAENAVVDELPPLAAAPEAEIEPLVQGPPVEEPVLPEQLLHQDIGAENAVVDEFPPLGAAPEAEIEPLVQGPPQNTYKSVLLSLPPSTGRGGYPRRRSGGRGS